MNEIIYIQSATDLYNRLQRIDQIITALELNILANIGNSGVKQYTLNDGQINISTLYTSVTEMAQAITQLEKQKQRLLNQLNGRRFNIRSWQGLRK